ncbi:MAG: PKD domain-containing protein [Moritella sp.]|uniref:PKD domain-containing protein n=1 Tax=Moritella sp. TaxID=78556 RepID=UPI0029BB96DF|nr:PKD domain-containing protein [Moritella sp.]MDX2320638.1 PKD domain-containing protein [Moritella sp.]
MHKLLLVALLSALTACGSEDIFDSEEQSNNTGILPSATFTYQANEINSPLYYFDGTYSENGEEYIQDDITWHWTVSLDGIGQIATLHPEENPQYQFLETNTYRVKATVSNADGDVLDSYYQDITITPEQIETPTTIPTAVIEIASINGLNVEFNGQNSTYSKGEITEFEWIIEGNNYSTAVRSHHFNQSGQYSVALKVKSVDGTEHSTTTTVNVSSEATVPIANFTYVTTDLIVNFDASTSSNVSSNIDSYNWYFPHDSSTANGINITKTFPAEDSYSVSLTTISGEGIEKELVKTVSVSENVAYVTCDILTSSHSIYRSRDVGQCFTSITRGPLTTLSNANTWCHDQVEKYQEQMTRLLPTNLTYEVRQQGNSECTEANEL